MTINKFAQLAFAPLVTLFILLVVLYLLLSGMLATYQFAVTSLERETKQLRIQSMVYKSESDIYRDSAKRSSERFNALVKEVYDNDMVITEYDPETFYFKIEKKEPSHD